MRFEICLQAGEAKPEEQEGDGGLEKEVKEEWLPSHHAALGD